MSGKISADARKVLAAIIGHMPIVDQMAAVLHETRDQVVDSLIALVEDRQLILHARGDFYRLKMTAKGKRKAEDMLGLFQPRH